MKAGVSFSSIKDKIKPLDLILFRGADFVSNSIAFMQKLFLQSGDWTHVGIVITTDIIPIQNGKPDVLYLWESTMSGMVSGDNNLDIEHNEGKFGVQIRELESVIKNYNKPDCTKVGWCKLLKNPLYGDIPTIIQTKIILEKIHKDVRSTVYNYNLLALFGTMFNCFCCQNKCTMELRKLTFGNDEHYFCSQLVCKIYQNIGIVRKDINPINVAPEELLGFSNEGIVCPVKLPPIIIK